MALNSNTTGTSKPSEPKSLGEIVVSRTHPDYYTEEVDWEFFLQTYKGGEIYIQNNLHKYFKEGDAEFAARTKRAYRENHSRRVVDLINSYLFKEKPLRDVSDDEKLNKFITNADGKGGSLNHFMKIASQASSVLGRIYIVVDKKPIPEGERTGTAADTLKSDPYCYIINPQDMMDIAIDDLGNVLWAIVRETYRRDENDLLMADDVQRYRYRLWEKGKWSLFDEDGSLMESDENGLESVPIIILDNEEKSKYSGQSLIGDIAYLDRAIFNNWSRLDTIVCDQTFSQLIFPIEGMLQEVIDNPELREQFMTLATNRILLYSGQAQLAPQFISPDASQAQFILDMIQVQVKQLYASIGLQAEGASNGKTDSSGVAKAYDFDKLNKLLANKADNLEQAEAKLFEVVKDWMDNKSKVSVQYPDEFDTRGLADELSTAERIALLDLSDTLMKEVGKGIAAKAVPMASAEIIKAINYDIEKRIDEKRKRMDEMDSLTLKNAQQLSVQPKKFGGKDDGNTDTKTANNPDGKIVNPRQQSYPQPSKSKSQQKGEDSKKRTTSNVGS